MPQHHQTSHSPHSPQALFNLVADIDSYQEFLPWCSASRITSRNGNALTADLVIRFKAFRSKYSSNVTLAPPKTENSACQITVEMREGPFRHLSNHWQFEPTPNGGTTITFNLDFQFKSSMLERMVGSIFMDSSKKMLAAFKSRANHLHPDL